MFRRIIKYILMTFILLGLALLVFFILGSFRAQKTPTKGLGVVDGKLIPCPESPNCVSTFETSELHGTEPLQLEEGSGEPIIGKVKQIISNMERTEIIGEDVIYLHAVFRSALFRFPDDFEVLLDSENNLLHFRSASRVGHNDFGVNRERIEALKAALEEGL